MNLDKSFSMFTLVVQEQAATMALSIHSPPKDACTRPPESLHGRPVHMTRLCTQRVEFAHDADHTDGQGMHFQEGNWTTGLHFCLPAPKPQDTIVYDV